MYLRRYNTPWANPCLELCLGPIDPSPCSKHRNSAARTQKFERDKIPQFLPLFEDVEDAKNDFNRGEIIAR